METIIIDISISAPLDLVWLAWVESNRIITWFAPEANVEPRIGGVFELFFDPSNHEHQSTKGCVFTSIDYRKKLVFTWKGPSQFEKLMNDPSSLTSVEVIFTETNHITHLKVKHRGWGDGKDWTKAQKWHLKAWEEVLNALKSTLESGEDILCGLPKDHNG